jgi:hypothetical protein
MLPTFKGYYVTRSDHENARTHIKIALAQKANSFSMLSFYANILHDDTRYREEKKMRIQICDLRPNYACGWRNAAFVLTTISPIFFVPHLLIFSISSSFPSLVLNVQKWLGLFQVGTIRRGGGIY